MFSYSFSLLNEVDVKINNTTKETKPRNVHDNKLWIDLTTVKNECRFILRKGKKCVHVVQIIFGGIIDDNINLNLSCFRK